MKGGESLRFANLDFVGHGGGGRRGDRKDEPDEGWWCVVNGWWVQGGGHWLSIEEFVDRGSCGFKAVKTGAGGGRPGSRIRRLDGG